MNNRTFHSLPRGLFRLAIITACAVFPLIFVGAGVTTKEVGMAYPDGFTSNGHLITNPPGWWNSTATRWEHGHRLLGRAVGVLSIILMLWGWKYAGTIRWMAVANLAAIGMQGVLGALRVNEVSTTLAMIHGVFGQICFCLTCAVALSATNTWANPPRVRIREAAFLQRLCVSCVLALLIQLTLGARVRHFPSDGALIGHIFWAMVVTFLLGWAAACTSGIKDGLSSVARLGRLVGILVVGQLLLGGGALVVTMMVGAEKSTILFVLPTVHVAVGAVLLSTMILLTLLVFRTLQSTLKSRKHSTPATVQTA